MRDVARYELPERLVTEVRDLGFEVLRLGPEMRVHAAADITVVGPTVPDRALDR